MNQGRLVSFTAAAAIVVAASTVYAFQPERPQQPPQGQPAQGQPGQRQPGERGARGPGGPGGQAGQTLSVEQAMKSMNRPLRQLRTQIGDATKKDENLKLINDMQRGCIAAKGQPVPHEVTDLGADDAAKAEMADEYRRELVTALRLMVDAEQAVLDGKGDEAKAALDELVKVRDHAHEELGIKDED